MLKEQKIKELRAVYLNRRVLRKNARKISDILPPEKIRTISKEILGFKAYKSEAKRYFAFGWRFVTATFFIFCLATGVNPFISFEKAIFALGGGSGKVELYAGDCSPDSAASGTAGWIGGNLAEGAPSNADNAAVDSFSDKNSASYQGEKSNLICGNFNMEDNMNTEVKDDASSSLESDASSSPVSKDVLVIASSSDIISATSTDSSSTTDENTSATTTLTNPENADQNDASSSQILVVPDSNASDSSITIEDPLPAVGASSSVIPEDNTTQASGSVEIVNPPQNENTTTVITETSGLISRFFDPFKKILNKYFGNTDAYAQAADIASLGDFGGAKVNLSFAVTQKDKSILSAETDKPIMTIWYSLDDASGTASTSGLWQELYTINAGEISNQTNGGYLSIDAPGVKTWDELKGLKIKLEGDLDGANDYSAFVDSVWTEAYYDNNDDKKNLDQNNGGSSDVLDFVSDKNDFKMGENLDFRFRYNKSLKSVADALNLTDYWGDVKINATLVDAYGIPVDIPLNLVFEDGGYFRVLGMKAPREFKPGKYFVRFDIEDSSGVNTEIFQLEHGFSWGVLAFNVNKSIYAPGEKAYLQMAVLDDVGHTLCNTDLHLTITNPSGETMIINSTDEALNFSTQGGSASGGQFPTSNDQINKIYKNPACGSDNVIDSPDYFAFYQTASPGIYQVSLTANTANGVKTITDQFEVRDSVPFDVERIGPTRVYPKANYTMQLRIKANENYSGDISDVVPADFKITDAKYIINRTASSSASSSPDAVNDGYLLLNAGNGDQKIIWSDVSLSAGNEMDIDYTINFPVVSPAFYLLGPAQIGQFQEARKWQIASDAVATRAKTVQFLGGTYSANGTTGLNTNTNQTFAQFNFQLMENSVSIKNAYVILEYMYGAYTASQGPYASSSIAFDSCAGASCGASAWTGTSTAVVYDATNTAFNETEANEQRVLLNVTSEAQLAAYTGNNTPMQAQIGYRVNRAGAVNSISYAKATLVITYTYDENSSPSITNTVIYPLESEDSGNKGTKATSTATNCVFGTTCPKFDYNMNIPEYNTASGSVQLSQWFQVNEENDLNLANDVTVNLKIGANATSSSFIHESSQSDQSSMPTMFFPSVAGYAENTAQVVQYRAAATALTSYLIGGEVAETYTASTSAATKTRTVSFPLGVLTNGASAATGTASVNLYLPENGSATGTVTIKKAWLRVLDSDNATGALSTNIQTKVGNNASSTVTSYAYDAAATVINPELSVIHIIPASDYAEMQNANAVNYKTVTVAANNSAAVNQGGITAELMITYAYTSDSKGYLTNLNLFAGQMASAPTTTATSAIANLVFPETTGKNMLAAGMYATYLQSNSGSAMPAASLTDLFDVNVGTTVPACSATTFRIAAAAQNMADIFNKSVATSALGTTDNQALYSCYASTYTGSATTLAKMNAVLNYTYSWVDTAPTSTISNAKSRTDGTGVADFSIQANDLDHDDLKAKIEYEAGTTCVFASHTNLTLDMTDANATSTYGDAKINNSQAYQIGSSTGWIITSSGMNTVNFDWLSKQDLPNINNTYCIRLTANDFAQDQLVPATTTIYIDNLNPTVPGNLTFNTHGTSSITLNFGASSTDTNFAYYKIFYKQGSSGVTEANTEFSSSTVPGDPDIGKQNFNNTSTTTIPNLLPGTQYVFNIWAYDTYGNKATATNEIAVYTDSNPNSPTSLAQLKADGSTVISAGGWTNENQVKLSAQAADPDATETISLYFQMVANASSSLVATTVPANTCAYNATYAGCVSKVWATTSSAGNYSVTPFTGMVNPQTIPQDYTGYKWQVLACDNAGACSNNWISPGTAPNFKVDLTLPTTPGNLTLNKNNYNSITLKFGATTTETNFAEYRIYYKLGASAPSEADSMWASTSDGDLININFNFTPTTTVTPLLENTTYTFNIWAYDWAGNKASATPVTIATNNRPTGTFVSANERRNGSGIVDASFQAADTNGDLSKAKIEYATGTACDFTVSSDPTLGATTTSSTSTAPAVDNGSAYQIGTTTGWIITASGTNTINFTWLSKTDLPAGNNYYCLRLTVNDGKDDQAVLATTTLVIDNVTPTIPGDLSVPYYTANSARVAFGATSTDTNFLEYRIYFKQGTTTVTEADNLWSSSSDGNLGFADLKNATSTNITGLSVNNTYSFRIWAYDSFGNKASSTNQASTTIQYILKSQNWRFYYDRSSETPTSTSAAALENTAPSSMAPDLVFKLRFSVKETIGINATNLKLRLQYSTFSDFSSNVNYLAETSSSTAIWRYGDGVDVDNAAISTRLLSDSNANATHNESGVSTSSLTLAGGAVGEWEFTIDNNGAPSATTYYFRALDASTSQPVALNTSETYPSLVSGSSTLSYVVSGLPSGSFTEGATTTIDSSANSISFGPLAFASTTIAAQRFSIDTDAGYGYQLFVYQNQNFLCSNGSSISPVPGTNDAPQGWPASPYPSGYGYHTSDHNLSGASPSRFAPFDSYARFETNMKEISYSPFPVSGKQVDMVVKLQVSNQQAAGDYMTNLVYIMVPTY